jgi:hypothetical protein
MTRPRNQNRTALSVCHISRDAKGNFWLRFRYHEDFIEALKTDIPWPHRKWDGKRRQWKVAPGYRKPLVKLLRRWFDRVKVEFDSRPDSSKPLHTQNQKEDVPATEPSEVDTEALFGSRRAIRTSYSKGTQKERRRKKKLRTIDPDIFPDDMKDKVSYED